jgi:hypothetical protein
MFEYIKYLRLLPVLANHPKLEQLVSDNMPEARQFVQELQALLAKHDALIRKLQAAVPEAIQLNNELAPIIAQLEQEQQRMEAPPEAPNQRQ